MVNTIVTKATEGVEKQEFIIDDLTVRRNGKVVLVAGSPINLTDAEFNMLEMLLSNCGTCLLYTSPSPRDS